jgi:Matrixin
MKISDHHKILWGYVALISLVSTTLGGYVACGAQKYRVPVHGSEPDSVSNQQVGSSSAASNIGSSLNSGTSQEVNILGVHSRRGWAANLPIRFKTSSEIPQQVVNELKKAMEIWEKATGLKLFSYDGVETKKGSSFKQLYEPLTDKVNSHYFDFDWGNATGKSKTVLATTIWENDPQDNQSILKGDIRYNAESYIFGDAIKESSDARRTIVDMQSLALHEVGHLLGLTHVTVKEDRYSVMNPSLFIGEGMMTRRVSGGDIERIRTIYGGGDVSLAEALEKADDFPENN